MKDSITNILNCCCDSSIGFSSLRWKFLRVTFRLCHGGGSALLFGFIFHKFDCALSRAEMLPHPGGRSPGLMWARCRPSPGAPGNIPKGWAPPCHHPEGLRMNGAEGFSTWPGGGPPTGAWLRPVAGQTIPKAWVSAPSVGADSLNRCVARWPRILWFGSGAKLFSQWVCLGFQKRLQPMHEIHAA